MQQLVPAVESPPFPFEAESTNRVRATLIEAVRRHAETLDALHCAVAECVRHLRRSGMSPEAMLVTMKAFIRHTSVTYPPPGQGAAWLPDPLMERIVAWCISEYYTPL